MATQTMAALVRGNGLVWNPTQPRPTVKKGCVLLRVRAASFNPIDYKLPKFIGGPVVGQDIAGVVEELGPGVTSLQVGDEVFGTTAGGSGGMAEFAVAQASYLGRKPAQMPWAQAAAMPVAQVTGLQALREHSGIRQGDKVLVIGASGGTGLAGLQLAKALGAQEVIAVCSGANAELCKEHGADRVIDYKVDLASGRRLSDVLGAASVDVVYDCATGSGAGENYKQQGLAVLKPGRVMTAINGGPLDLLRFATGWESSNHRFMLAKINTADLEYLANLNLKVHFAEDFAGAQFCEANVRKGLNLLQSRRARGKIAFVMD